MFGLSSPKEEMCRSKTPQKSCHGEMNARQNQYRQRQLPDPWFQFQSESHWEFHVSSLSRLSGCGVEIKRFLQCSLQRCRVVECWEK